MDVKSVGARWVRVLVLATLLPMALGCAAIWFLDPQKFVIDLQGFRMEYEARPRSGEPVRSSAREMTAEKPVPVEQMELGQAADR